MGVLPQQMLDLDPDAIEFILSRWASHSGRDPTEIKIIQYTRGRGRGRVTNIYTYNIAKAILESDWSSERIIRVLTLIEMDLNAPDNNGEPFGYGLIYKRELLEWAIHGSHLDFLNPFIKCGGIRNLFGLAVVRAEQEDEALEIFQILLNRIQFDQAFAAICSIYDFEERTIPEPIRMAVGKRIQLSDLLPQLPMGTLYTLPNSDFRKFIEKEYK